jgi:mannose/fructose/N-acetylgalactosamine-specific phosphotransferase system component IIC
MAGLAAVERKGFLQAMLSRPIVLAPAVGWALGDATGGLLLGPPLELLWLGAVNLGAAVPVHEALGTAAVAGGAVLAAHRMGGPVTPEVALLAALLALPAALLGRWAERSCESWNERIALHAETVLAEHRLRAAARCNLYGLLLPFAISAAIAPCLAALAALVVPGVLGAAPWLATPLRVSFFTLAAFASAAAARALRARAAPRAYFGAAAGAAALGLFALYTGRAL